MLDEIITIFKNDLNFRKLVYAKLAWWELSLAVISFFAIVFATLSAMEKNVPSVILFCFVAIGFAYAHGWRIRNLIQRVYKVDLKEKDWEGAIQAIRIQYLKPILLEKKANSLDWLDRAAKIIRDKAKQKEVKLFSIGLYGAIWLPVYSAFIGWRFGTFKDPKDAMNYFSSISTIATLVTFFVWFFQPWFEKAVMALFNREAMYFRELADILEKMALDKSLKS